MKFNDEQNTGKKSPNKLWVLLMTLVILMLIGYSMVVNNNEAGHYVIIEPLSGSGSFKAIMHPGRYFKWFNRTYDWDKSATYWFSVDPTEGEDRDQSVQVRYNDGGTAKISGSVRYIIGEDEDKFIKLHVQYRNQNNFRDRAIRALVTEALTLTATLMSAEESYTTNKAQFTEWALDQLNHGVYLVETYTEKVKMPSGEIREVRRSKLRRDPKTGEIMRKEYALEGFDIKFTQFVIQDPDYHKRIRDQIAGKLHNLMGLVASQAEAELRRAEEEAAIAEGQRDVVISEYEQKVENVVDIISAEIAADTSRIMAEARKEVAAIMKKAAEYQKDADILVGEGEAAYKKALQRADSNMEIRLKLWLAGHLARAEVISKNGIIYPDWIQPSGDQAQTGMGILNYDVMKRRMLEAQKK